MKKLFITLLSLFLIQNLSFAKDVVQFDFPNEGWHKVASPDGVASKKCYVPYNQTTENHTEMLVFYERVLKNQGISPMVILHKQLGKDIDSDDELKGLYHYLVDYNKNKHFGSVKRGS